MKYDVCVFGGCSLDQMFYQHTDGSYNEKPDMKVPGGKGSNQAIAASRAGAKTTIITRIGKDEIGKNILENLRFNGVNTSHVDMVENLSNDYSNIYIRLKDKDNKIERVNGAIDSFTPDMIDKYSDVLLNSNVIVCQLKVPKNVTEKLINFCHEHKKFLILTPCRPTKLSIIEDEKNLELINKISLITCNKEECITMFGTQEIEEIVKKFPNKLIVTLGKDGLIYFNGNRIIKMPAIDTDVIDTIGAGDTLCGNLACFLSQHLDLKHALRKAMYSASMKLQVKSAQAGMPFKDDLEDFIAETRNKKFSYHKELSFAMNIVKNAYNIAKSISTYHISTKPNNTLVTEVDIAVENYLIDQIKSKFPYDNFLTEENNPNGTLKDRTWVIDPIDGTSHFVKNTPYWGIQLAFYDKNRTKFGIIYLPVLDEFYYAVENQGAYVNNNKILLTPEVPLNQAIVEFGGTIYKQMQDKKVLFYKLVKQDKLLVSNIMHINSSCISFTNLASKKTDALITSSKKLWDIMPGICLLREAGIKHDYLDFDKKLSLYTNNEQIRSLLLPENI